MLAVDVIEEILDRVVRTWTNWPVLEAGRCLFYSRGRCLTGGRFGYDLGGVDEACRSVTPGEQRICFCQAFAGSPVPDADPFEGPV